MTMIVSHFLKKRTSAMCNETNATSNPVACCRKAAARERLIQEFQRLQSDWWWFLLFGILLMVCGVVAFTFPILASAIAVVALGIVLMVAGLATIVASLWAGKWSGMMVQVLVGILYLVVGMMIGDHPALSAMGITLFVASLFIVVGMFRGIAALVIQFPHWGWALLNGVLTFLLGVIICRHYPQSALWVIGLLIGIEMLFHGWTWVSLALAIRNLPAPKA
jgi:uncharacterized membrane protein HdeD (DUF308 family)